MNIQGFSNLFGPLGTDYGALSNEDPSRNKKKGKTSAGNCYRQLDETDESAKKPSDAGDSKQVDRSSDSKKAGENTEVDEDDCGICGEPTTDGDHIQNVVGWNHPDGGRAHADCHTVFTKMVLFNKPKNFADKMIKIARNKKCHIGIIHSEFVKHLKNKTAGLSLYDWMIKQANMDKIIEKVWEEVEKMPVAK